PSSSDWWRSGEDRGSRIEDRGSRSTGPRAGARSSTLDPRPSILDPHSSAAVRRAILPPPGGARAVEQPRGAGRPDRPGPPRRRRLGPAAAVRPPPRAAKAAPVLLAGRRPRPAHRRRGGRLGSAPAGGPERPGDGATRLRVRGGTRAAARR